MITTESLLIVQHNQSGIALSRKEQLSAYRQAEIRPAHPVRPPQDTVAFSEEGRRLSQQSSDPEKKEREGADRPGFSIDKKRSSNTGKLSENEAEQVLTLQQRDREVRTHEQAHLAAAGQYAQGGASYTYQRGPDGKMYAVAGEVSIDVSKEQTPEETIDKMETVIRAALAPVQPSSTDRQVAAQALATINQARQELQQQHQKEISFSGKDHSGHSDHHPSTTDTSDYFPKETVPAAHPHSDTFSQAVSVNQYL